MIGDLDLNDIFLEANVVPRKFLIDWQRKQRVLEVKPDFTEHISSPSLAHLWLWNLSANPHPLKVFLTEKEHKRRASYIVHHLSDKFCCSRAVMKLILSYYSDIPPEEIIFSYEKSGKPYLEGVDFTFNHSHSSHFGVLLLGRGHLGVDVEDLGRLKEIGWETVAERFFHSDELSSLKLSKNIERDFFKIWTYKEAWTKALGLGIRALSEVPPHSPWTSIDSYFSLELIPGSQITGVLL